MKLDRVKGSSQKGLLKNKVKQKRLSVAMKNMVHKSNPLLDKLPGLHMDHIFTTNYSYCLEQAFFPNLDFRKGAVRSKLRLDLRNEEMKKDRKRELHYRLHTCYHFGLDSDRDNGTGLWHIHGESSVSRGIILGHDRYGRMLFIIFPIRSIFRVLPIMISWHKKHLDFFFVNFNFPEN